jgi:hypothetical protein
MTDRQLFGKMLEIVGFCGHAKSAILSGAFSYLTS